jgi:hypothetical protein
MNGRAWMAAAGLAAFLLPPAGVADEPPDLTGRWQLNSDRSEDARKKMEEAREDDRRGRGGIGALGPIGPGPRGGGPMGGGPMGGRPTRGRPAGDRDRAPHDGTRVAGPLRELMDPPKVVVIAQTEGEVTFDTGDDSLLRLRPGGRKVKREGGAVDLRARWKDGELLVEAEHEDGQKTETSYRVTSDRQELHVTTELELPTGEKLEVHHIYDAVEGPATPGR